MANAINEHGCYGSVVLIEMRNGAERIGTLLKQPDDDSRADPDWLRFAHGMDICKKAPLRNEYRASCCVYVCVHLTGLPQCRSRLHWKHAYYFSQTQLVDPSVLVLCAQNHSRTKFLSSRWRLGAQPPRLYMPVVVQCGSRKQWEGFRRRAHNT
jgi:hypothetical protein